MFRQIRKWRVGIVKAFSYARYCVSPPGGTLVYIGGNRGHGLARIAYGFGRIIVFEPNPEAFQALKHRLRRHNNITFENMACGTENGEAILHVSNNAGIASSLAALRDDNAWSSMNDLKIEKTIAVPVVNLMDYLTKAGVSSIDLYVSDIQNFDLAVLRTLEPLIRAGQIAQLEVECTSDSQFSQYPDTPDCSISAMRAFLEPEYQLVAVAAGTMQDGNIAPEILDMPSFDTRWRPVKRPR